MNNVVFGKTMENVRKHRDIKLVTTKKRRSYLVSEPNYHTKEKKIRKFISCTIKSTQIFMNKPVYLGQSIIKISKIAMY